MRVYGRTIDNTRPNANFYKWQVVQDDDDNIRLTHLIQVLQMDIQESPFYSNWGMPVANALITGVLSDVAINNTINQFAQYFAALQITRGISNDPKEIYYQVDVVLKNGKNVTLDVNKITR